MTTINRKPVTNLKRIINANNRENTDGFTFSGEFMNYRVYLKRWSLYVVPTLKPEDVDRFDIQPKIKYRASYATRSEASVALVTMYNLLEHGTPWNVITSLVPFVNVSPIPATVNTKETE